MKSQRAVVGASLDAIKAKRTQKPEVRAAQRQQALRTAKEKKKVEEDKKKAEKAKVGFEMSFSVRMEADDRFKISLLLPLVPVVRHPRPPSNNPRDSLPRFRPSPVKLGSRLSDDDVDWLYGSPMCNIKPPYFYPECQRALFVASYPYSIFWNTLWCCMEVMDW